MLFLTLLRLVKLVVDVKGKCKYLRTEWLASHSPSRDVLVLFLDPRPVGDASVVHPDLVN